MADCCLFQCRPNLLDRRREGIEDKKTLIEVGANKGGRGVGYEANIFSQWDASSVPTTDPTAKPSALVSGRALFCTPMDALP